MTGPVDEVVIPGINGQAGIFPQHAKYITLLKEGDVMYRANGGNNLIKITGGIASVHNDAIILLVDGIVEG